MILRNVDEGVAVALLLQAILFGYGGLTTLGVNVVIMAVPGVCVYLLFGRALGRLRSPWLFPLGAVAGALAVVIGAFLLAAVLVTSGKEFTAVAVTTLVAHVPVMVIEGLVTGWAVLFLRKVRPETFHVTQSAEPHAEPAS